MAHHENHQARDTPFQRILYVATRAIKADLRTEGDANPSVVLHVSKDNQNTAELFRKLPAATFRKARFLP